MVLKKSQTADGIDIVLWDFEYPSTHFYSIMTYPIATRTDDKSSFGAKHGERFCLPIDFKNLEDAEKGFKELESGEKKLLDFKQSFSNKRDLEFILDENVRVEYINSEFDLEKE